MHHCIGLTKISANSLINEGISNSNNNNNNNNNNKKEPLPNLQSVDFGSCRHIPESDIKLLKSLRPNVRITHM